MNDQQTDGLFVVFEGGEGAGKSTQVGLLCDWLAETGRAFLRTFEPGDSAVGKQIRSIVLDPSTGDLAPKAESLLYAADKAHHLATVVRPALARGAVVVCDRYVDSMLAYQGAGRVLDLDEVEHIARWATDDLRPDLTVLLDGDPAELMGGIADRDRIEAAGDDFHRTVRDHFRRLAARDPEHYLVLPARQSRDAIAAAVRARITPLLPRGQ
ncbi:dTMP kinase [Microlunatus sp. Gsoil 973]|uniref:dTMP kinase n=1 Tax=Microlunatus sp. Gsoil 973 TaxID=2672569 RepID=UPI0012B45FDD|nr:dTMP kinase [Microlunatus sp. Gsoil 973]QGN33971.1 dTMP kinase [Microlunatus sp. Gsoil 973]